jgi:hypothetical protein
MVQADVFSYTDIRKIYTFLSVQERDCQLTILFFMK